MEYGRKYYFQKDLKILNNSNTELKVFCLFIYLEKWTFGSVLGLVVSSVGSTRTNPNSVKLKEKD